MKATNSVNKTNKKVLMIVLTTLTLLCFIFSVAMYRSGMAQATLSGVDFNESYTIGAEIDVPDGTITVGGQDYTATPVIYFPDGNAYSVSSATLSQKGKYTVEYSVTVGGKVYSVKETFTVNEFIFSNSVTGEGFKYVEEKDAENPATVTASGIRFDIKPTEKFLYNAAIDLSDNTKDETFLKFNVRPAVLGTPDALKVYITLADAYDSSNYITIIIKRGPVEEGPYWGYVTSGHAGTTLMGYDYNSAGVGTPYFEPTNYGHGFRNGLGGKFDSDAQPDFDFRFDYESKQLWTLGVQDNSPVHRMVCDYTKDFGENVWKGFTTGEVMLSIWADEYSTADTSKPFSALLMELDGKDLKAGTEEDGTVGAATVTTAPTPEVDFGEFGSVSNIPKAMVGYGYKVFDAKVASTHGGEKLTTRVYYGYNTSTRYEVSVKDGRFVPDMEGIYSIVYKCTDIFGNTKEVLVDVEAISADSGDIEVTVPGHENHKTCNVGETFTLVSVDDIVVTNYLGKYDVVLTAKHQNSGEVVTIENNSFSPILGGKWTITYSVTDYVGRPGEFVYEAEVIVSDGVVFEEGIIKNLNNYLILGAKNPIPTLTYIDYNVSATPQKVSKVYLATVEGAKVMDVVNGYVTPTTAGEYKIVYEATSNKGITETKSEKVTVVDVGYGQQYTNFHFSKYFYSASNDIVDNAAANTYTAVEVKANGSMDFIRPLNATNLSVKFNLDASVRAAEAVIITLTDINNVDQVIKLELNSDGKQASLNGGTAKSLSSGFSFGGNSMYEIIVKNGQLIIGGQTFNLTKYLNGSAFTGFDSMLVEMNLTVVNPSSNNGNTKFKIGSVGNQAFFRVTAANYDRSAPELVSNGIPSGTILKGETVTVGKAVFVDVVDAYAVGTLSVLDANGNALTSVDGITLDKVSTDREYQVTPEVTGRITFKYELSDSTHSSVDERRLQVISRDAPVIEITKGATTGGVGQEITVGSATIPGMDVDVYVYVRPPVGRMKQVDAKTNKFKADVAGKYEIVYIALDEFGNLAVESYFVTVS